MASLPYHYSRRKCRLGEGTSIGLLGLARGTGGVSTEHAGAGLNPINGGVKASPWVGPLSG